MTAAPAISVIMAAYNGAELLPATLASLQRQTFTDFEVIVVDDRSTDNTLDVLRSWPDSRVRVIALDENGGPVRARNRAFAEEPDWAKLERETGFVHVPTADEVGPKPTPAFVTAKGNDR